MRQLNREFLMLAHDHEPRHQAKHKVWWASEKLDGHRAFWDGGLTRGMLKSSVWWANNDKDERYVEQQVCTGLWSRYGNVIHAPSDWLDQLPVGTCLDGELWTGRGEFQRIGSIVKSQKEDKGWFDVHYMCFDVPVMRAVMMPGKINNANFKKVFPEGCNRDYVVMPHTFLKARAILMEHENDIVRCHAQHRVHSSEHLNNFIESVASLGGEGVILRAEDSFWMPYRQYNILKLKPFKDSEGVVTGYKSGRIGKEGRRHGKLGALIIEWNGIVFELSGFNDSEIELSAAASEFAYNNPDTIIPMFDASPTFPHGSKITFKYRELSNDGIPKEARYWRKYND